MKIATGFALVGLALASFAFFLPEAESSVPPPSAVYVDFELTDHNGKLRRDEDFRDKHLLAFFGFANCPGICPMTLAEISTALDSLGKRSERINAVFISVDPKRDSVEALDEYLSNFHPDIVGLTGDESQIAKAAEASKIHYEKMEMGDSENYMVQHSSNVLLFDGKGRFIRLFSFGESADAIAEDLKARL